MDSKTTHPDFRLFACMNPVGDVDKRTLPHGIRTRFTEFYVDETSDPEQLTLIIRKYLPLTLIDAKKEQIILDFYSEMQGLCPKRYRFNQQALIFH